MKTLTSSSVKQQQGFTLIELVIVIVILGILAATAAPKFIDLTGDAKSAVMKGVEGSMESAVSMIHAKALVDGKTTGTNGVNTIEVDSVHYALVYGYPAALSLGDGTTAAKAIGIVGLIDLDAADFDITDAATTIIKHKDAPGVTCQLTYTKSSGANVRPLIDNTALEDC
jgi:MSHA pilin protein MshA